MRATRQIPVSASPHLGHPEDWGVAASADRSSESGPFGLLEGNNISAQGPVLSLLFRMYRRQTGASPSRGPQFASVVHGIPLYAHHPVPTVTQPGTIQWLNPDAFLSALDASTGQCSGGDDPQHCQFGNLGRNSLRGPDFIWRHFYLTKWFPLTEHAKLRFEGQFFNVFNHPNLGLPSMVLAGIPGKPSTQTGFWSAHLHNCSADRLVGRRFGRR